MKFGTLFKVGIFGAVVYMVWKNRNKIDETLNEEQKRFITEVQNGKWKELIPGKESFDSKFSSLRDPQEPEPAKEETRETVFKDGFRGGNTFSTTGKRERL